MLTKPRLLRLTKGLRQVDVVSLTEGKVTQPRLSMIERGITPRPDEAAALAQAFQVRPEELFSA